MDRSFIDLAGEFTFSFTSSTANSADEGPIVSWIQTSAAAAIEEPFLLDVETSKGLADDHRNVADGDFSALPETIWVGKVRLKIFISYASNGKKLQSLQL